jgi:hypothetical protein
LKPASETTLLLVAVIAGTAGAGASSTPWAMYGAAMIAGCACGRIVRLVERVSK